MFTCHYLSSGIKHLLGKFWKYSDTPQLQRKNYSYTYNHHHLYRVAPRQRVIQTRACQFKQRTDVLNTTLKRPKRGVFKSITITRAVFPCQTASECRGSLQLINTCVRTKAFVLAMTLKLGHERYATRDVRRACEPTRGACAATRVDDDRRRVT